MPGGRLDAPGRITAAPPDGTSCPPMTAGRGEGWRAVLLQRRGRGSLGLLIRHLTCSCGGRRKEEVPFPASGHIPFNAQLLSYQMC